MKKIAKGIFHSFSGKIRYQQLFENLYYISLSGMNYRNGSFRTNGELHALNHIKKNIIDRPEIVLFDVGANKGNYTLELSRIFAHPGIQIHSFEPSKNVYAQMLEKVGNLHHIKPNNFGFSDSEATLKLFSEGEPSFLSSVYQRRLNHAGIEMNKTEEITLTTIDIYCAKNNIKKIDFLKMDVEGHEFKILEGAKKMIDDGKIDFIQFEFGGCNIDSRTYFQDFFYFLKDKYNLYRIVKDGLFPIKTYKETYEIFTLVNFLACIR